MIRTHSPKKSLGQHFLTDDNISRKIVNSLTVTPSTPVLEIGAGKGILTKYLLEKTKNLWISEIDKTQVKYLTKHFTKIDSDKILPGDILTVDFTAIFSYPIALIGNFPYYISSPILFKVLENKNLVAQVVCMLQKEVAERICSKPGSKTYGILSVLLQTFYVVEYLFSVSSNVFHPPPKVSSAVIRLKRNNYSYKGNEKFYFRLIKTAFNQRRKMLKNSLKSLLKDPNFSHPLFTQRPEQLRVEDFISLATKLTHLK